MSFALVVVRGGGVGGVSGCDEVEDVAALVVVNAQHDVHVEGAVGPAGSRRRSEGLPVDAERSRRPQLGSRTEKLELGQKSLHLGQKSGKSWDVGQKSWDCGQKNWDLGQKSWDLGQKIWDLGQKS